MLRLILSMLSFTVSQLAWAQTSSQVDRHLTLLDSDIAADTVFFAERTYVVAGEVHILSGVTLTIEDGVNILIRNGQIDGLTRKRAALVFDPGSKLRAQTVSFHAANGNNQLEKRADNAGLWFLGSTRSASKDGVSIPLSNHPAPRSRFQARSIHTAFLGAYDQEPSLDDIDGISILGVGRREWLIAEVESIAAGDDGFDVTNSHIVLERLSVRQAIEDGLNISSSRVVISKDLTVSMGRSRAPDREIFDFEVDDGPSFVSLERGCRVEIDGYFGDEVQLTSDELPAPEEHEIYWFVGKLSHDGTEVFSLTED